MTNKVLNNKNKQLALNRIFKFSMKTKKSNLNKLN